ncbi:nucleotide-diphospho-sugar transferase [Thelonectria olida]|uniref:Nucleotide-diphospho-sugar transferase n=1 Tax=Thelonectria olida TaxID=1576542 RepID=A0A9P8WBU5_9HYPO|nr:nucleotide-diphospho-sugar transferase [Thelonectria olida]
MTWHKWPMAGYLRLPTDEDASTYSASFSTRIRSPSQLFASKRYRWVASLAFLTFLYSLTQLCKHGALIQHTPSASVQTSATTSEVDWSRFAYTQYVTNSEYLCNSVMFFEALHRLGSRADRVIMYPAPMLQPGETSPSDALLLSKARDDYNVKLVPITIQHKYEGDQTWADSFTKLLAFNQTQYSRVLSIDSDSVILQDMDELFLLPPAPVAMPRAYWLFPDKPILSSQVMLIQPSEAEFARVMDTVNSADLEDYDMEIVNHLYGNSALIIPHRPYDLLTAEFRFENHTLYLGTDREKWDPVAIYNEAKLIHFSDWPLPKPWLDTPEATRLVLQPRCHNTTEGTQDCAERVVWNNIYSDFKTRRKEICDLGPPKEPRQAMQRP